MLTQSTGYAISALGVIAAAAGKPVLIKDISEIAQIPTAYLAKIINALSRKGIVKAQRGIGGGITLLSPADKLSAYDICEIMDEPAIKERCTIGNTVCNDSRACPMHAFWKQHRAEHINFLKKMTVSQIASFELKQLSQIGNKKSLKKKKPKNN